MWRERYFNAMTTRYHFQNEGGAFKIYPNPFWNRIKWIWYLQVSVVFVCLSKTFSRVEDKKFSFKVNFNFVFKDMREEQRNSVSGNKNYSSRNGIGTVTIQIRHGSFFVPWSLRTNWPEHSGYHFGNGKGPTKEYHIPLWTRYHSSYNTIGSFHFKNSLDLKIKE